MNPTLATTPSVQTHRLVLTRPAVLDLLLFVTVLALRLPFMSQVLYHWDAVNFAYAIGRFDLAQEQPQPPGYILFVGLSQLVNLLFNNPPLTLTVISVVASGLAVIVLAHLGNRMFGPPVGWMAAALLATSPLFWFYGEIALPHTLDTALILLACLWLYRLQQGEQQFLYPAVIVLGVLGGLRQQSLVFLLPLALFAVLVSVRRGVPAHKLALATLLGAAVCLAWFLPLISLSGGLDQYLAVTDSYAGRFQDTTSVLMGAGWAGVRGNLTKLVNYTAYGWGLAALPLLGAAWLALRRFALRRRSVENWDRWLFLALWIGPALLFYSLIHMGQQGLIFVYLPALFLLSAAALQWIFTRQVAWAAVAALVLIQAAIFLVAPEFPVGRAGLRLLNRQALVHSDQYHLERIAAIRANLDPATTAIAAVNWRHVQYYLPEYTLVPLDAGLRGGQIQDAPEAHQPEQSEQMAGQLGLAANSDACLVLYDPGLSDFLLDEQILQPVGTVAGERLDCLAWPDGARLELRTGEIGVRAAAGD